MGAPAPLPPALPLPPGDARGTGATAVELVRPARVRGGRGGGTSNVGAAAGTAAPPGVGDATGSRTRGDNSAGDMFDAVDAAALRVTGDAGCDTDSPPRLPPATVAVPPPPPLPPPPPPLPPNPLLLTRLVAAVPDGGDPTHVRSRRVEGPAELRTSASPASSVVALSEGRSLPPLHRPAAAPTSSEPSLVSPHPNTAASSPSTMDTGRRIRSRWLVPARVPVANRYSRRCNEVAGRAAPPAPATAAAASASSHRDAQSRNIVPGATSTYAPVPGSYTTMAASWTAARGPVALPAPPVLPPPPPAVVLA